MGQNFQQDSFSQHDHQCFRKKLQQQLVDLRDWIDNDKLTDNSPSIGAELEMYLVDNKGEPCPKNQLLIDTLAQKQLVQELNQFNLEYNLSPVDAKGTPFSTMEAELRPLLDQLQTTASNHGIQVVPIGILPTLKDVHLERRFMTDLARYRALTNELSALKGEPFNVDINGKDCLKTSCDEVTLEGANTSFQVHLKVPVEQFAEMFNTAQLITPLVLALSGNSPTFLGKRLWQETRIALFKQSIDNRIRSLTKWRQPSRVSFGQGWLREDPWECFAESVALYPPILPYLFENNEPFAELNLHHGTVWSWNRAVLEPKHGGHLRIEYRAFPAGPTVSDMMASAAMAIGLTVSLSDQIKDFMVKLPFQYAEYNFYRAAKHGLEARLLWPQENQHQPTEQPVSDIIKSLLPRAADGLSTLGVEQREIDRLMAINENRLATGQTGSIWQLNTLSRYQQTQSTTQALHSMLQDYINNMTAGDAVYTWR